MRWHTTFHKIGDCWVVLRRLMTNAQIGALHHLHDLSTLVVCGGGAIILGGLPPLPGGAPYLPLAPIPGPSLPIPVFPPAWGVPPATYAPVPEGVPSGGFIPGTPIEQLSPPDFPLPPGTFLPPNQQRPNETPEPATITVLLMATTLLAFTRRYAYFIGKQRTQRSGQCLK